MMKITVVTAERKIYEIKEVESFDYDAQSKDLRYFSNFKFVTVEKVEIMHVGEDK